MRPLGVGLVYWPGLQPLVAEGLVDLLEVEPQSFWQRNLRPGGAPYTVDRLAFQAIADLGLPTLLHGVASPVGGSTAPEAESFAPLAQSVDLLQPAWVSEHLSFNVARRAGRRFQCGFLLPPRQTEEGVACAVAHIDEYRRCCGRPFAFETGTSYLQPRADEMPDGEFFAQVAARADCGILLDLHNLWANQRNGRASVASVLARLPLARVWELHLAGGCLLHGYWLDGHCDAVPEEVLAIARELVPALPKLGAIVFEVLPQHVQRMGLPRIARQLQQLRDLWALRRPGSGAPASRSPARRRPPTGGPAVAAWEDALGSLVQGHSPASALERELAADPGVPLLAELVFDLRCGQVCNTVRLSATLILLTRGAEALRRLLCQFAAQVPADLYSHSEGWAFARFLRDQQLDIPALAPVLAYETALLEWQLHGRAADVLFEQDPVELLGALLAGELPARPTAGSYRVAVGA